MQARRLNRLLEPKAATQITAALAPYLLTWTDVRVTYAGRRIDRNQANQVDDYIQAALSDPRFANVETTRDFYLVVRSVKERLMPAVRQAGKPEGLYSEPTQYENAGVRGWVRTWSEILREAKQRLEFVKKSMNHSPSLEQALAYLRHRHGDLLPDQSRKPTAVATPRSAAAHNPAV